MRTARLAPAFLLCVLLFAASLQAPAAPQGADRARFEVLQAAYFSFSQVAPTHQGLDQRCVLVEHYVGTSTGADQNAQAAALALVNNTSRTQLAYAEIRPGHARFVDYYRTDTAPMAVFDGLSFEFGGGQQASAHYLADFNATASKPPDASINVSGGLVLANGFLDYDVFSPLDLTGYTVTLRAFLIEDHVPAASGGGDERFLLRAYLSAGRLEIAGNSSFQGRINFTVEAGWIESRLSAIVFVQVDAPPPVVRPPPAPAFDALAMVIPLAVLATGATMAFIVSRYIRAERRSRMR